MKGLQIIYMIALFSVIAGMVLYIVWISNSQIPPAYNYDARFDRIETAIKNSAIDLCFSSGGKWITDGARLIWQDVDAPTEDGSIRTVKVAQCVIT